MPERREHIVPIGNTGCKRGYGVTQARVHFGAVTNSDLIQYEVQLGEETETNARTIDNSHAMKARKKERKGWR